MAGPFCVILTLIIHKGNSLVQFNKNMGTFGGALHVETNSTFTIDVNFLVIFNRNEADLGEAVYLTNNSTCLFKMNAIS